MSKIKLIVTSTFGLEAIVKREVQDMGFDGFTVSDGKIEFEATVQDIPRLNLWLRTADRVLLKLGEFPAKDFGQLFDQTKALPWEDWITQDAKITVIGKSVRSQLVSVRSCQSIVKKAIIDRLKDRLNADHLPETGPEFTIQVAILKDIAQLTLDTSGLGLHKRGYRASAGEVPMRENLAAALVLLSFWDKDRQLIDPMCGSGTILIEAAMIGRNIAPGLKRTFAAELWPAIDRKVWEDARLAARRAILPEGQLKIFGYDFDPERIMDCRVNAKKAGVGKDIVFEKKDIRDLHPDGQYGIVITNPPYGVKLGDPHEMGPIYYALDKALRDNKGWSLYILTADKRFPEYFKRAQPDRVRKLFNGTIEVNYYQYYGERPPKEISGIAKPQSCP
jgi:putative N6-adenine-specific DNA methylase